MDRRIFIGGTKQLPAFRVMAQDYDSPQTRPMQALALKCFAHFVDKSSWQEMSLRRFTKSLPDKGCERPAHPRFHRQNEPAFRTIVNRRGKKVPASIHEQTFHPGITFLHRDGKAEDVLD